MGNRSSRNCWRVARPVFDLDEDHTVIEERPNLDILADKRGELLQSVSPVEDLLDRHPPVSEALRSEVGVIGVEDAEAYPEVLGLACQVVDLLEKEGLEVHLDRSVKQVRDEVFRDLLLEEDVVAVVPGGLHLGEVGVVEERHLCLRAKVRCFLEGVAGRWLQICVAETVLSIW